MSDFRKVYEEYAQSVYRFLLTLSGSEELAEELLQETFFQAYQHINGFEGRCNLFTWLCQIAKNAWLKECRRKKRYTEASWEELTVQDPSQTPEERLLAEEEYRRVRAAVLTLEEPYRDVFILHALGGIKLKEIAFIYQKTESWARVTYFRAKQRILQEVTE